MATYTELRNIYYQRSAWNDCVGSKANNGAINSQQTVNALTSPYNTALKNVCNALNNKPQPYKSRKVEILSNLSEVSL